MARVIIELEIQGSAEDAIAVVEAILDNGDLQELVNNDESPLHVTNAACHLHHDD